MASIFHAGPTRRATCHVGTSLCNRGCQLSALGSSSTRGSVKAIYMEEEVPLEEMEEATLEEECALRACESVEATAAEKWTHS